MATSQSELLLVVLPGDSTISLIALTALYGIYLVLFVLAIWSTYLRATPVSVPMRASVLAFFCMLLIHIALQFSIWTIAVNHSDGDAISGGYKAMTIIVNLITCLCGFLAEAQLAWRTFVVWGRKLWMKMALLAVVGLGTTIGIFANIAFARFSSIPVTYQLLCFWGWWTFLTNSVLSGAVTVRIFKNIAARRNKPNAVGGTTAVPRLRVTIFRAMIESSFFAWVGVAAYTMVNTAFWANSTSVHLWSGSAGLFMLLPLFFAIAHHLSVALVGLSNFVIASPPKPSTLAFAQRGTSGGDVQTGFVVKMGDSVPMAEVHSIPIRVQEDVFVHKDE
jgi:hypothetical protein